MAARVIKAIEKQRDIFGNDDYSSDDNDNDRSRIVVSGNDDKGYNRTY